MKQVLFGFVGNLCVDPQLRLKVAQDCGGLLSRVFSLFQTDVKERRFDWVESVTKELAVLINSGMEMPALVLFQAKGLVSLCEELLSNTKLEGETAIVV